MIRYASQVMLGIAWATLPDLPTYRTGVIMVGLARCIAMVMIWNQLANGDVDYCAVLVIINSLLQIVLYSPMSLLFVNVISGEEDLELDYSHTAIAVCIYLGIPLAAGVALHVSIPVNSFPELLDLRLPCGTDYDPSPSRVNL
jgi:ACR3 family arsenite transporter